MAEEKKPAEPAKPAAPAAAAPAPAAPGAPPTPPKPVIELPKAPEGQMCLRVNGKDHFIDPKKYKVLIQALHELGYDVPHFCYHPGLAPDGNCRMCYVNVIDTMSGKPMMALNLSEQPFSRYPKPTISCREPLNPRGMVIETESESVKKARQWVMEFLLINHPLDCPVCDKAGECMLQNNSYDHGKADSRFAEAKNEKAPKDLFAPDQQHGIKLWTDRCITCTRCVRFLDEVSGTSELYVTNRGDRSEIDIAPGHPLNNELMGNVVDICPVGCLIDREQMFSYRAWYLQKSESVCPDCAKGCNIEVHSLKEYVRRLVPRENRNVNDYWMCDRGRHDFKYINSDERVMQARVKNEAWPVLTAAEEAGKKLKEAATADPNSVGVLVSAWLTLEELHAVKLLCTETLKGASVGLLAQADWKEATFPKFKIEADHNPNRRGAQLVFGDAASKTAGIIEAAKSGKLKALYVISSMPDFTPGADLLEAIEKVPLSVVQDLKRGALTQKAAIVLPGSSFAEKDGVYINSQGRLQILRRGVDPLGQGNDDLAVIQRVARGAGADVKLVSAREYFRKLAPQYPALAGITYKEIGHGGFIPAPDLAKASGD